MNIGSKIAHYLIEEKLGEGGMGIVFKAFDTKLERTVALKILRPETMSDPDAKARFIREAKAASGLNHPNITIIHEIGEWHGRDYICMEYVEGQTLKQKIKSGPLSIDEVLNIADQFGEGASNGTHSCSPRFWQHLRKNKSDRCEDFPPKLLLTIVIII